MRFIGDIHGDIGSYAKMVRGADESVQIGDFGIGFLNRTLYQQIDDVQRSGKHRFIRGNHDDPTLCKERPGYIPDGTFDSERSILYIGGAWSIDYRWRTPGLDWWPDEELSVAELARMHELAVYHKPRIMITHDCPTSIAWEFFIEVRGKNQYKTRTAEAFEGMFIQHKPELWIFGHWHESVDRVIDGTRFVCLDINRFIDVEV